MSGSTRADVDPITTAAAVAADHWRRELANNDALRGLLSDHDKRMLADLIAGAGASVEPVALPVWWLLELGDNCSEEQFHGDSLDGLLAAIRQQASADASDGGGGWTAAALATVVSGFETRLRDAAASGPGVYRIEGDRGPTSYMWEPWLLVVPGAPRPETTREPAEG